MNKKFLALHSGIPRNTAGIGTKSMNKCSSGLPEIFMGVLDRAIFGAIAILQASHHESPPDTIVVSSHTFSFDALIKDETAR